MTEPNCKMVLLTQADFDGELDTAHAAELATHRDTCAECQAAHAELSTVRVAVRDAALYQSAPESLRRRVSSQSAATAKPSDIVPLKPRTRWFTMPALNFGMGAAMAAAVALLVSWTSEPTMLELVVDDHVRALQPGHLMDVVSTDRHTVKPWFEGRIDFTPPVKDLVAQKFPLTGGRLDVLNGRPIAALIYQHGTHPIELLVWPGVNDTPNPTGSVHNGFNTVHWTQDGMTLWAVSDLERAQVDEFVRLWRSAP